MYTGPNTVNDGLVFGYDTAYGIADNDTNTRFYKGKPTTNMASIDLADWGIESGAARNATGNYYKGQPTYNCRSAVGSSWLAIDETISGLRTAAGSSGTITMSLWVRNNFDAQFNCSAYMGHDFSSSRTIAAHADWQRIQWTVNQSSMNSDYVEFRPHTNNANIYLECTMPQVEVNVGTATPWVDGERSNTESIIDLTRTTNIDVSNLSFDSTGQPTFDGTDDSLTIPGSTYTTSNVKTIEIVFKMNGSYSNFSPLAVYANGSSSTNRIWLGLQDSKFQMHGWGTTDPRGTTTISADEWYVCTFSYNKSTQAMKVYTNGVLESNTTNTQGGVTASSSMNWYLATVPGGWQGVTYSDTSIASFKVYNRILSDDEVAQNFNAYKNRFNI